MQRMPQDPRSDRIRTKIFLVVLKRSTNTNPSQPMTALEKKQSVTKMIISDAVRKDFEMKSQCRRRRTILTAKSKVIRKERSPMPLHHLKHHGGCHLHLC